MTTDNNDTPYKKHAILFKLLYPNHRMLGNQEFQHICPRCERSIRLAGPVITMDVLVNYQCLSEDGCCFECYSVTHVSESE